LKGGLFSSPETETGAFSPGPLTLQPRLSVQTGKRVFRYPPNIWDNVTIDGNTEEFFTEASVAKQLKARRNRCCV